MRRFAKKMSQRKLVITEDGSHTIFDPDSGENYHSTHGAIQESRHVFIEMALKPAAGKKKKLNILEIGWGSGLNTLLTAEECDHNKIAITYVAVEPFPITLSEASQLNYFEYIGHPNTREWTMKMHAHGHQYPFYLNDHFVLNVLVEKLENLRFTPNSFDVVYFDAFSPEAAPDLWTTDIFSMMYEAMQYEGVLTTYCAKGEVRRRILSAGFYVERIPGAPGKREMLRATKLLTDPKAEHHHCHEH